MAPAPATTRVSAAAARRRSAATAICPATWTAASLTPAASPRTAWRSAWSAAACAFPREGRRRPPRHGACQTAGAGSRNGSRFDRHFAEARTCHSQSLSPDLWPGWLCNASNVFPQGLLSRRCDRKQRIPVSPIDHTLGR